MRIGLKVIILAGLAAVNSGCMSEEFRRADGLTDGAGDTIAGNTVMQMVDPWQDGVQDTRLLVPAARATAATSADDVADASQSQTTGSN
jgi:hypothetical protein